MVDSSFAMLSGQFCPERGTGAAPRIDGDGPVGEPLSHRHGEPLLPAVDDVRWQDLRRRPLEQPFGGAAAQFEPGWQPPGEIRHLDVEEG